MDTLEAIRKGGTAHEAGDPAKGPAEGTPVVSADEGTLFDDVETADEKALKWRFLAKGATLDSILAVMGAEPVEGPKQVAFKVKALGNRDLAEVFRAIFEKAHGAKFKLPILLSAIRAQAAGIDVKAVLDKLVEQATRKAESK